MQTLVSTPSPHQTSMGPLIIHLITGNSKPIEVVPPCPPGIESFEASNDIKLLHPLGDKRPLDNLTKEVRTALRELKSIDSIVIKPADKGAAVVIQNHRDYVQEALRQLSNLDYYRKVPTDLISTHQEIIKAAALQMEANSEISEHSKKYLLNYEHRTARFYMLPKIHKGVTHSPGRPIISGNGCPTERISHFVDHFMRELAPFGASYLKDTTHFLQTLEDMGQVPGTLLVMMDVTSLYTNIPNGERHQVKP